MRISKENYLYFILMIITVPLAGELKIFPFNDTFRVSFGSPFFFFFLLFMKRVPPVLSGFVVGICVVIFRITLDFISAGGFNFSSDFTLHISAMFYYLAYSFLFYITRINELHDNPLMIGFLSVIIEIVSSIVELSIRHSLLGNRATISILLEVIFIAVIRSFFTLSFFTIIKLRQTRIQSEQRQRQNEDMILFISSLYEESIELKKSLKNSEDITRECYNLYQDILDRTYHDKNEELARKVLNLAGQIHDFKKDNQRIYSGLTKIISSEKFTDYMNAQEIGNIIVETNKRYAFSLNKTIDIILDVDEALPPIHVYTVLSLINNLVSNSVESIINVGIVSISIKGFSEFVEFIVSDNGEGIPEKKKTLIFKPGYTTKYDFSGRPSTGMGLPYVSYLVKNLKGTVSFRSGGKDGETVFIIRLPLKSIALEG